MADYFPLWLTFGLRFLELASTAQGRTNGLHGALTDVGLRLLARRTVPTERNTNQGRLSNRFARLLRHSVAMQPARLLLYGGVHRLGDSRVAGLPERNIRGAAGCTRNYNNKREYPMSKLPKALLALACVSCLSLSAYAQEAVVTLKVHHFLPAHSLTQANLLKPWADEITEASDGRIQFQFYPSMQLGGTPPQLVDQVRDGVADIVWTLPGYNSGRFPLISVFEQPFMSRSAKATSQAMWEFVAKHGEKEFTGMHLLATHTTDGTLIHTGKKPINKMADFRGKKIRAANRTSTKLISLLGGTPVAMPVPQIPEALSKGVVDGAIVPWDVVPALKLHELVGHHTEMAEGKPALMYTVMILAMNPATYEGLPDDLRKIIDERSGAVLSRRAGQLFDEIAVQNGHRLAESRGNKIHQLSEDEQQKWMKVAERLDQDWIKEVEGKGYANGAALLEDARQLIQQHSDTATR